MKYLETFDETEYQYRVVDLIELNKDLVKYFSMSVDDRNKFLSDILLNKDVLIWKHKNFGKIKKIKSYPFFLRRRYKYKKITELLLYDEYGNYNLEEVNLHDKKYIIRIYGYNIEKTNIEKQIDELKQAEKLYNL